MKTFKNNCTSGLYVKCLDRIMEAKEEFSTNNCPEMEYLLNNNKVVIIDNTNVVTVTIGKKDKEKPKRIKKLKEEEIEPKIELDDESDNKTNEEEE